MTSLEHWILVAVLVCLLATAIALALIYRRVAHELSKSLATAEKAYSELTAQSARRERELLHELKTVVLQRDDFHGRWQAVLAQWKREVDNSERLIGTVRQYAKDIRETMVLMKDETPPKELVAAEEALRLHDETLQLRNQT